MHLAVFTQKKATNAHGANYADLSIEKMAIMTQQAQLADLSHCQFLKDQIALRILLTPVDTNRILPRRHKLTIYLNIITILLQ